ncbi:uncharacterized protein [Trachinotus anak]|uniref:uncharacterized protein n=1 Tax=Trachinotus anak TaxID=443729 RepID=UPI0039F23107
MMNFNVVAALLCTCSWISVSVSEFHTVEVQSGEEVTLLCTNYTSTPGHIHWFRLDNGPNISCISSMSASDGNVSFSAIGVAVTVSKLQPGWISVSVSEFHTVEVQSGEDVTLQCTNYSITPGHIIWFRLDNRPNISLISSMSGSDGNASFCDGFKNGKFNMTSNMTTLFLQIKSVDSSDSGLYFCGSYWHNKITTVSATYLKVQEVQEESVEPPILMTVVLGGPIIILIIVVIVLVVKIRKLHAEERSPQHRENQGSENLNYAALNFHSKAKRSRRPASERELEPNVVYAATR